MVRVKSRSMLAVERPELFDSSRTNAWYKASGQKKQISEVRRSGIVISPFVTEHSRAAPPCAARTFFRERVSGATWDPRLVDREKSWIYTRGFTKRLRRDRHGDPRTEHVASVSRWEFSLTEEDLKG